MSSNTLPLDHTFHGTLTTLAPIVTGANVSRPLIDTPTTKIILFAMDAGQAISSHHAPWPAVVQVIDGVLAVEVSGVAYQLKAGDWLLMPAQAPHALQATEPSRWMLTLLKGAANAE